ncbi:MAG: HypC/HybG/HupF family hydrogenase formation chaperone [Candidatus Velthaea sp.]|jgi:hydrogenase expression/formation protein HypC
MCLAIPAQIVEFPEGDRTVAVAEVSGVRRRVNVDLLRGAGLATGDWVLLHVGFAMSRISEEQAREQMDILQLLGEAELAMDEVRGYNLAES